MDDEAKLTITFGKCPRCGKSDILVVVDGLKPFCRVCLKTATQILLDPQNRRKKEKSS